jgi:coatomer subunit beta'
VKTIEVSNSPVRCAKFIARKQWIVTGSDDLQVRFFNYNTLEKIKTIEAHTDYIRSVIVHPTLSYVFSTSDDTTIKMWDWDSNFNLAKSFEDHQHYVMTIAVNPRDPNTFASASMDKLIKVRCPGFLVTDHRYGA